MFGLTAEEEQEVRRAARKSHALEILAWFSRQEKGATVDRCCEALGLLHHAASSTVSRLARTGCLIDTGKRRVTRSRHTARVYKANLDANFSSYLEGGKRRKRTARDEAILEAVRKYHKRRPFHTKIHEQRMATQLIQRINAILDL